MEAPCSFDVCDTLVIYRKWTCICLCNYGIVSLYVNDFRMVVHRYSINTWCVVDLQIVVVKISINPSCVDDIQMVIHTCILNTCCVDVLRTSVCKTTNGVIPMQVLMQLRTVNLSCRQYMMNICKILSYECLFVCKYAWQLDVGVYKWSSVKWQLVLYEWCYRVSYEWCL